MAFETQPGVFFLMAVIERKTRPKPTGLIEHRECLSLLLDSETDYRTSIHGGGVGLGEGQPPY